MTDDSDDDASAEPKKTERTPMTAIGMTLGMSFGVAFGAAFGDMSSGLIWGMIIGMIAGSVLDVRARSQT